MLDRAYLGARVFGNLFGGDKKSTAAIVLKETAKDRTPPRTYNLYGEERPIPAWINANMAFFRAPAWHFITPVHDELPGIPYAMSVSGQAIAPAQEPPSRHPLYPPDVKAFLEAPVPFNSAGVSVFIHWLYLAALQDRWNRKQDTRDQFGRTIWPPAFTDGAPIIDTMGDELLIFDTERADLVVNDHVKEDRESWTRFYQKKEEARTKNGATFTPDDQARTGIHRSYTFKQDHLPSGEWPFHMESPFWEGSLHVKLNAARRLPHVIIRGAGTTSDNPFAPESTLHGDAAFAWITDMEKSSVVNGSPLLLPTNGTLLGWFGASNFIEGDQRQSYIYAEREGHEIIIGPPGSGKFQAAIAPLLLTADKASAMVLDVKNGEAAKTTFERRKKLGSVLVLDPFGVSGLPSGALNPLDLLKEDDPQLLEKAKRLTDALFILEKGAEGKDQYWNDQAQDLLSALLVHVATHASEEGQRTLKRVREIIRRPFTNELLLAMGESTVAGGVVADVALNLIEAIKSDAEKNTYLVQQTLRANTAFLDLPTVQDVTATTTLNPQILRERVGTLYVVVPEHELKTMGRWLRLVYAVIMEQMRSDGVPLHVIVDEFPSLGAFHRVADDMARVRYLNIRMHVVCQSLNQLQAIYGTGWQDFVGNARFIRVLGVNDQFTAEYLSKRLGKTTARATSSSENRGASGGGSSTSSSWVGVDLVSPDQLTRMNGRQLIVLVEGDKPLRLIKLFLYENSHLQVLAEARDITTVVGRDMEQGERFQVHLVSVTDIPAAVRLLSEYDPELDQESLAFDLEYGAGKVAGNMLEQHAKKLLAALEATGAVGFTIKEK